MKSLLSLVAIAPLALAACGPSEEEQREAETQERRDAFIEEAATLPGEAAEKAEAVAFDLSRKELAEMSKDEFVDMMLKEGASEDQAEAMWNDVMAEARRSTAKPGEAERRRVISSDIGDITSSETPDWVKSEDDNSDGAALEEDAGVSRDEFFKTYRATGLTEAQIKTEWKKYQADHSD